jgi:hypothetical protein
MTMNILDYIDWRGDLTFAERGLNEVDNLIFSTLAYLTMDGLVSDDGTVSPTIGDLYAAYCETDYDQSVLMNDPRPLLKVAAQTDRFKDVRVSRFVNVIDAEKQIQFSAVTYRYAGDAAYIAFRGTDNTLVGWREDMNFSFLTATPGQNEAAAYLNRVAADVSGSLIVGGHSKGGNFAVYAAAFCDPAVRERIVKIYSNDGPGFRDEIVASENYHSILDRTVKIIPDSSLVGILLSSKEPRRVIRSSAKGLMQHDPFTWNVLGTRFVGADERNAASIFMDDTLNRWVATLSDNERRVLVNVIFDSLEATGASTLLQINENRWAAYNAIFKAISKINSDKKGEVMATGRSVVLKENPESVRQENELSIQDETE